MVAGGPLGDVRKFYCHGVAVRGNGGKRWNEQRLHYVYIIIQALEVWRCLDTITTWMVGAGVPDGY